MGSQALHLIQTTARNPSENPLVEDRLLWLKSKRGRYSTKEGYNHLRQVSTLNSTYSQAQIDTWARLWKWRGPIPRVKAFIWRATHQGLPTMKALHRRIEEINPMCPRCGSEEECLMHLLFRCPISKATWYMSELGLRVEELPLDFVTTLIYVTDTLLETQIINFANILWCLWKVRNEEVFAAKKNPPATVILRAKQMEMEATQPPQHHRREQHITEVPPNTGAIHVDGSWEVSGKAGLGVIIYDTNGLLVSTKGQGMITQDPLEAEALAVLTALEYTATKNREDPSGKFIIYTDCKTLVQAISTNNIEELPNWRTAQTVAYCIRTYNRLQEIVLIHHAGRESLTQPHNIANWARRVNGVFNGYPSPAFRQELQIQESLDPRYFQWTAHPPI